MPAIYAHLQFGKEVIKALPPAYTRLVEAYPQAFALGTQGPNLLTYHHPFKGSPVRTLSSTLHNAVSESFFLDAGKRLVQNTKTDILEDNGAYASYVCGFLTHFVLDALCHGYIYSTQDERFTHNKIETEFDKTQLRKAGKPVRGYNPASEILPDETAISVCSELLGVPTADVALCIKTMRRSAWWFSNKIGALHALAHFILFLCGLERRFGDMFFAKKDDALCAETNEKLEEKFAVAVEKAKTLIENYFTTLPQAVEQEKLDDFFRYNYSGTKYTGGDTE